MLVGTEVCIASKHAIFNNTSKKLADNTAGTISYRSEVTLERASLDHVVSSHCTSYHTTAEMTVNIHGAFLLYGAVFDYRIIAHSHNTAAELAIEIDGTVITAVPYGGIHSKSDNAAVISRIVCPYRSIFTCFHSNA